MGSSGLASELPGRPQGVVDLDERAWLPRHCRGDSTAFPALLEAYRRPVYSYLVRCGVAAADRDDLFQNIFLKVHAAAGSYEPARPLGPWLFTIVANSARNHFRGPFRGWPDAPPAASYHQWPDPADPRPDPERIAQGRETVAWLEAEIADLPPAQREVLLLAAVLGQPQQDVAEALDLPLNTVKTHLRRARLTLAEAMARRDAPAARAGDTDDRL